MKTLDVKELVFRIQERNPDWSFDRCLEEAEDEYADAIDRARDDAEEAWIRRAGK